MDDAASKVRGDQAAHDLQATLAEAEIAEKTAELVQL